MAAVAPHHLATGDDGKAGLSVRSDGPIAALAYAIYRWRLLAAAVEPFLEQPKRCPPSQSPPFSCCGSTGITPVIVLCALMVFFLILVSTGSSVYVTIDSELLEAAALVTTGWTMAAQMELPLQKLPAILGGSAQWACSVCHGRSRGRWSWEVRSAGTHQMRSNVDTAGTVIITILCIMATICTSSYRIERLWALRHHAVKGDTLEAFHYRSRDRLRCQCFAGTGRLRSWSRRAVRR